MPVEQSVRDGHTETWWALEMEAGPYGPQKPQRVIVATTAPRTLSDLSTWYLVTNLPAPRTERARESMLAVADQAEVVRLYGLRMGVEQGDKHTKHALGWSKYQRWTAQTHTSSSVRVPGEEITQGLLFLAVHHEFVVGQRAAPAPGVMSLPSPPWRPRQARWGLPPASAESLSCDAVSRHRCPRSLDVALDPRYHRPVPMNLR
jgi:hypothetical protein